MYYGPPISGDKKIYRKFFLLYREHVIAAMYNGPLIPGVKKIYKKVLRVEGNTLFGLITTVP